MAQRPHFIIHNRVDNVGVVVVEDARSGQDLVGWVMEDDTELTVRALDHVPLGHKIAVRALKSGETVIKYEHDIGKMIEDVAEGGYVHAHNLKTKRW